VSRIFIALYLIFSFGLILHSQGAPTAKIKQDTSVSNGSGQVILSAGATVQVLSVSGDKAVVNCTTADGSPLITQIAVAVLDFQSSPTTSAPSPASSGTNKVAAPSATNSPSAVTPPPAQSSTASVVPASPALPSSGGKSAPISTAPLNVADASQRTLEESLVLAGDNRSELQKFLGSHPSPEAALLIRKARQSDLVNLTDQLLSDNIASVEKAKANAKWADRVPPEIWREFVLPYRVADEPLDDFKPEFYDKLAPIVATAEESGDAALLVHHWYWFENNGASWVTFKVSESRDQSPRILLDQTKIGRCFEMNLLCVALLRSVGIPARLAGTSYWMNDEFYHYWVEYYDTKTSTWLYYEGANPDTNTMMAKSFLHQGARVYPTAYALPGFCPITDPIGKERWDVLINTTLLYLSCGTIHFEANPVIGQSPPVFTAYSWNLSAWRSVAQVVGNTQGEAEITISANDNNYPYLVSTAIGGRLYWQTVTVVANNSTDVTDSTVDTHPSAKVVVVVPPSNAPKKASTGEL
jgi:Transglutaminase-like superfamily